MSSIEKVSVKGPDGRWRDVLLTSITAGDRTLSGIEVDTDGIVKDPPAAYLKANDGTHGERRHVIVHSGDGSDLRRVKMVCDHVYGWLVPDGTATQQTA